MADPITFYSDVHIHVPIGNDDRKDTQARQPFEGNRHPSAPRLLARRMVLTFGGQGREHTRVCRYNCDLLPGWVPANHYTPVSNSNLGWHVDRPEHLDSLTSGASGDLRGRIVQIHFQPTTRPPLDRLIAMVRKACQQGATCILTHGEGLCSKAAACDFPNLCWELSLFETRTFGRLILGKIPSGEWLQKDLTRVRQALRRCGWNGKSPPTVEESTAAGEEVVRFFNALVKRLGPERVLFGSSRSGHSWASWFLNLVLRQSSLLSHEKKAILVGTAERILRRAYQCAGHNGSSSAPVYIRFLAPYQRTDPSLCTGSMMIERGLAAETNEFPPGSLLLSPCSQAVLSRADAEAAGKGLCLIDGPWQALSRVTEQERQRGLLVRRIPEVFTAQNPFYRADNPRYFPVPDRFATAEAAGIALLLLGYVDQASEVFRCLDYGARYTDLVEC